MLHVITWKWQQKSMPGAYIAHYVNVMDAMLERNMGGVHYRHLCITDDDYGVKCNTFPLWTDHSQLTNASKATLPSCYRRLKLFDPMTQAQLGINPGDRIVSLDLDSVITGSLKSLMQREERFISWAQRGTYWPLVFNGSFFMFTAGDLAHIWHDFDPQHSPTLANRRGFMGSDQAWLSMNLVNQKGSVGIEFPLFASYPKAIRQLNHLQHDTRIIFFHGRRKPWHEETQRETPWLKRYWKE